MSVLPADAGRAKPRDRIAIVLPNLTGGGVEKMRIVLAREFLHRGFDVDFVLAQAKGEQLAQVPSAAGVIDLKARRLGAMLFPLIKYLRERRPQAVLAAMWPVTSIATLAVKLTRSDSRVVISDHNMLSHALADRGIIHRLILRSTLAITYPLADELVVVSRGIADDICRLAGLSQRRFHVIHNPAFASSTVDIATGHGLWGPGGGDHILSVGSFKAQKNQALLIRAFAELSKQRKAKLLLLGDGVLRPQLQQLACDLGVEDRVLMPGFAVDPGAHYDSSDLFVLSSDYEGFGNAIVEALAAGVPVVSTDCPSGPADILENGRYGELVPCGDVEALAEAMARALEQSHDKEALRARAQAFSPAFAAEAYLRLLFPTWESGVTDPKPAEVQADESG